MDSCGVETMEEDRASVRTTGVTSPVVGSLFASQATIGSSVGLTRNHSAVKNGLEMGSGDGQAQASSSAVIGLDESEPLLSVTQRIQEKKEASKHKLSMLLGVTVPCILSIFSVILFLRLGFVLGNSGYWQTILMIIIGYLVVILTVLSISAIATSATVEGGGVYFMISRALGPEFGGSVGVIFFIANVFASAAYIIGFVEALVSNFGKQGILLAPHCEDCGLPDSQNFKYLYTTIVLLLCFAVCVIGPGMFAKATFLIFCAVMISLTSSMFSFGYVSSKDEIPYATDNHHPHAENSTLVYSGWSWDTFKNNWGPHYGEDYTQPGTTLTFQSIFAIMFNGCTGIMAGANISGDLKNPSVAIPQGTLLACAITFAVYIILFTFSAFTCDTQLLLNNYNYLQYINVRPELIALGVFAATLSAALSTLIGASRVLQALAKDRLFSGILHPFTWTVGKSKNPIPAVLLSWLIVQATLFLGKLNAIAPFVTMFFLVSYAVVNLACFALKVAAAPNFRPTFQIYARYTSAIGALGCLALMFAINALYAAITFAVMLLLFVYLLIRGPATPWGDVSQALIYHQVRKYLLRLDIRKSHVKFWRPEVLMMVANPRSAYSLINFTNDMKKGGIFVLGHVIPKPFSCETTNYYNTQLNTWLTFVEISKVKAFVELTMASTIRAGTQSLLATAGLGGMKPNTLVMGYYDDSIPTSQLDDLHRKVEKMPKLVRSLIRDQSLEKYHEVDLQLPPLRDNRDDQIMTLDQYVGMIQDAIAMSKNVCIMRHFEHLHRNRNGKNSRFIDVWPLQVRCASDFDKTFLLTLQFACVLHMKNEWKSHKIRIFVISDTGNEGTEREILCELLKEARIEATVVVVAPPGDKTYCTFTDGFNTLCLYGNQLQYYQEINDLMREHSSAAGVIFTCLPPVPELLDNEQEGQVKANKFIKGLDILSGNLPPTVMVHGNMSVMTTTL